MQIASMLVACPAILSHKLLELERNMKWLMDEMAGGMEDVVGVPRFLGSSLMQVIGPRCARGVGHACRHDDVCRLHHGMRAGLGKSRFLI